MIFFISLFSNFPCYRNTVDKREVLENMDLVLLCLDEIVDGGYASIFKLVASSW